MSLVITKPVPAGEVAVAMGVRRRRRMAEIQARRPDRLVLRDNPQIEPRVIEVVEGLVEAIEGDRAEVFLHIEEEPASYSLPAFRLRDLGIQEGDRFHVEIIQVNSTVSARIKTVEIASSPAAPAEYLTPDALESLADSELP